MEKILKLIILNQCLNKELSTSYYIDRICLKLGLIVQVGNLIEELNDDGYLTHQGLFQNEDSIYKSIRITDKGKFFYNKELKNTEFLIKEFPIEKEELVKKYLGLSNDSISN